VEAVCQAVETIARLCGQCCQWRLCGEQRSWLEGQCKAVQAVLPVELCGRRRSCSRLCEPFLGCVSSVCRWSCVEQGAVCQLEGQCRLCRRVPVGKLL
jgi:hypothetical protein